MLFNSFEFIAGFIPVTLIAFFLIGRWVGAGMALGWLVLASLFFYGWWNPPYLVLIISSIIINFMIGSALVERPSRVLLALGVALNLAAIGYFKYAGFIAGSIEQSTGVDLGLPPIILPLAISFFTFQQVAYLVDAYRHQVRREGFVNYALFVTFYPQLIAGPIVHHSETMPQFANRDTYRPQIDNLVIGIAIFTMGLFKKVVLADGIATYATPVFEAAQAGGAPTLFEAWGGALSYTFQLYFDFSGYSDMAIGLARMVNIRLPVNFASPYKAVNIVEFWRRWHITLSRFLRDYLYYSIGGNRRGPSRRYVNIMVTMLLGGLWHGAGWTFVIWGGLHGLFLVICHGWHALRRRLGQNVGNPGPVGRIIGITLTFLVVTIAWVPFRAESFDATWQILAGMTGANGVQLPESYLRLFGPLGPMLVDAGWRFETVKGFAFGGVPQVVMLAILAAIAFLAPNTQEWFGYAERQASKVRWSLSAWLAAKLPGYRPGLVQGALFGAAFCAVMLIMFAETPSEFLYFQF